MKKAQITQYSSDDDSNGSSDEEFSQLEDSDMEAGDMLNGSSNGASDSENERDPEMGTKADDVRKKLADVPFNQLIRIQQQVGAKKFNKAMGFEQRMQRRKEALAALKPRLNKSAENTDSSDDSSDSDSDSSSDSDGAPETAKPLFEKGKRMTKRSNPAEKHRRSDKNKPTVMSSKRPVGRFRQIIEMPKSKVRDPRFDGLSGNFNEDLYEKTYAFLDDQQKNEMELLEKQAVKLKKSDPDEARKVQMVLGSMKSRIAAKSQKKKQQELKRKHRNMELDAAQQGKKPYFLKKRELKELEVAEKFSKLKDSSRLDGYLEKRRKRNATKDHRRMPFQRRDE
ncbi:rRNA biogenesis protein rrp36 [Coemansia sp. RSA 1813]|nr:rRNA biogenesis protein rrp36 [Coemansia sp. RSA 1646]KAJ1770534.1 rRNA biogenesis protein rrp36 [Coemansia sp. RSA 1843]KAJ2092928.1 rRNA biogenesis protein rrp36 [Coemansia sp. RSA 986]KAJ2216249.1 rRNA biogenesis protein rrp36 [Coemansia sp. RSA 487]KAJ2570578.1 rRNA biogenesis protein rrp36 [Coemansia sp. RSA 1813]